MLAWMYVTMPSEEELERQRQERQARDTIPEQEPEEPRFEEDLAETDPDVEPVETRSLGVFGHETVSDTIDTWIETPKFRARFTNLGGGPASLELKQHKRWDGGPVQLMSDTTRSAYSLEFLSTENYNIETDELLFRPVSTEPVITLNKGETTTVQYELELEDGSRMIYTYTIDAG